jgi:hypothetical protein
MQSEKLKEVVEEKFNEAIGVGNKKMVIFHSEELVEMRMGGHCILGMIYWP